MLSPQRRASRMALAAAAFLLLAGGCASKRERNSPAFVRTDHVARDLPMAYEYISSTYAVPVRDLATFDPLWRHLFGSPAMNTAALDAGESSFYVPRASEELTPARVAAGSATAPPPQPPFTKTEIKTQGASAGFTGTDATGRKFLFKFDDPEFPELGTSAEIIGSRVLWALGYRVPPTYLVRIAGTGDPQLDGRRAVATLFLDNARGHFHFDDFRYRREIRALRIASAWLNDGDRCPMNTLIVADGDRALGYLIDFNSCLGAWQGRPQEAWRGWHYFGDVQRWPGLKLLSAGGTGGNAQPPLHSSPAIGRFDSDHFHPLLWRPQWPNNAFDHLTGHDLLWIIDRIRPLQRPHLEAVVASAELSDSADAEFLVTTLLQRRAKILALDELARAHGEHPLGFSWSEPRR